MAKKELHPKWHNEAKVVCNGEEVLVTSGTQDSYTGA
jgi:large subunit ribosomal protein L31